MALALRLAFMCMAAAFAAPAASVAPTGKTVEIAPGVSMPAVSLGTCCGSDPKVGLAPWFAAGGTGIDTALDYKDQPVIGQLLAAAKKPRGSYFMTTKIPTHRVKSLTAAYALSAVQTDVKQLGIGRLDLVLIHHPAPTDAENQALWKGLEQAVAMNLTRSIGLSNFNKEQIEALLKVATIRPALNQCDLSVGGQDTQCGDRDQAIAYNLAHNITYEAWSPMKNCPFTNPTITAAAAAHKVSASQICLRWVLDRGCTIAVGTGSDASKAAAYSKENLDLFGFALTKAELAAIDNIAP